MRTRWFETVAAAQRRAQSRLPPSVYRAILAGTEKGLSYKDNVEAFDEIQMIPHVADLGVVRDLQTTFMGQEIAMPVVISPTGVQAVHPLGEVAVARAAASRGTVMALSSFASKPIEDVIKANPRTVFQMYWLGDKGFMLGLIERAKAAGAVGLILTLDWSFSHHRDWGSPFIPVRLDLRSMIRLAPEALRRPSWLFEYVKTGRPPRLITPNLALAGSPPPTFFSAYGEWMQTPPARWTDITWLREQWIGPLMLKGIGSPEDARRAVDCGATAISVSNHGGNNIDGTPAPARLLPAIQEAVGKEVEIVLDGGIRRGSDVVKAIALGARSVMIGRASLWGLAANGQAGVENVLEILRDGIESTLRALGRTSIHEISQDDVLLSPCFVRSRNPHKTT